MTYKDQIKNKKLTGFIHHNKCTCCDNVISSKASIGFQGGNSDFCMSCNVKKGLIK